MPKPALIPHGSDSIHFLHHLSTNDIASLQPGEVIETILRSSGSTQMDIKLSISSAGSKKERYEIILQQILAITQDEHDFVANLANISSILYHSLEAISWVGFYLLKNDELVLGPFHGKPACVRIAVGKGVCGTAVQQAKTILVSDVEQFPGHIYCDLNSRSEIVVPIYARGRIIGVLDVDSSILNTFDDIDRQYLETVCKIVSNFTGR